MIIKLRWHDQSSSEKNDWLFVYEATNNVKKQMSKQKDSAVSKGKPFGTSHAPVVTTQGIRFHKFAKMFINLVLIFTKVG